MSGEQRLWGWLGGQGCRKRDPSIGWFRRDALFWGGSGQELVRRGFWADGRLSVRLPNMGDGACSTCEIAKTTRGAVCPDQQEQRLVVSHLSIDAHSWC